MSALLPKPIFAEAAPVDPVSLETFTARALTAGDVSAFRALRLKALRTEPDFLGVPPELEERHSPQHWRERCTETPERCFFGLFQGVQQVRLVGIASAERWPEDASGTTALWKSTYLEPELRGRGVLAPLYRARETWTARRYDRAVFFIRDGNTRSMDIHIKNGARSMFTRQMSWGERPPAPWHWFEKPLRRPKASPRVDPSCAAGD